jgi:hypothetical protein
MKKKLLFAAAIGCLSTTVFTASAASAVTISYPTMTNNDPAYSVTITNVQWSGSYNLQIAATVSAGLASTGTFKTVLTSDNSYLSFRANITHGVTT